MLRRRLPGQSLLLLLLLLPLSCGYGLGGRAPSVMGEGRATLKLLELEQPTLLPWVGQSLRQALRDEIRARNLAVWVDEGPYNYSLRLKVNHFTLRSGVSDALDATLLYNGSVQLTAVLYRGEDGSEVWRDSVSYSSVFESSVEEDAAGRLFGQAMRLLADRLRRSF